MRMYAKMLLATSTLLAASVTPTVAQVGEMDPCIRRELDRGNVAAAQQFTLTVNSVGDTNGDGHTDFVSADPNYIDTPVSIWCGAKGTLIHTFKIEAQDRFVLTLIDAGDVNGDGLSDVGIASRPSTFAAYQKARITLHSGKDGEYLGAVLADGTVVLPEDVNASGAVDPVDVIEANAQIGSTAIASVAKYDLNRDKLVSQSDVFAILAAQGSNPTAVLDVSVVLATLASVQPGDGDYVKLQAANGNTAVAGIRRVIKCFFCGWDCGDALDKAWDCRNKYWDRYCACFKLPDLFDQADCQSKVRREGITECLDDVIEATGECADCIKDCRPTL